MSRDGPDVDEWPSTPPPKAPGARKHQKGLIAVIAIAEIEL